MSTKRIVAALTAAALVGGGLTLAQSTGVTVHAATSGTAVPAEQYVQVSRQGYAVYSDFNWTKVNLSAYQQTYLVKQTYAHSNGSTYDALYTTSGKFVGLINAAATRRVNTAQGQAIADRHYVTVTGQSYQAWQNFNWRQKASAATTGHHTYLVKYRYQHANGSTYYSIYKNNGSWAGYINANAAKNASTSAGVAVKSSQYLTVTSKNYKAYSTFSWRTKHLGTTMAKKTYQMKYVYYHFNGSTYASAYNGKGTWQGYINIHAGKLANGPQGAAFEQQAKVIVKLGGGNILWNNFTWSKRHAASTYETDTVIVKRYYKHVNGSTYDSLYSTGGQWLGYLNSKDVYTGAVDYQKASMPDRAYPSVAKYPHLWIKVSLAQQRVYLMNGNTVLYKMYCSTGYYGPTPKGTHHIQAERGAMFASARYWVSWKDHGVYLFHTTPINSKGQYIKAEANYLGRSPHSHGCVRLTVPDAYWLYKHIRYNTKVVIQ